MRVAQRVLAPLACVGGLATAGLLAWAPASLDFVFVVALAVSWCIWLDEHPAA